MSAKFAKAAFNHENKVLLHGVTRKGGRGFPPEIIQDEKTTPTDQMAVHGTVKAAVLRGRQRLPRLGCLQCLRHKTGQLSFNVHGIDCVGGEETEGLGQVS